MYIYMYRNVYIHICIYVCVYVYVNLENIYYIFISRQSRLRILAGTSGKRAALVTGVRVCVCVCVCVCARACKRLIYIPRLSEAHLYPNAGLF